MFQAVVGLMVVMLLALSITKSPYSLKEEEEVVQTSCQLVVKWKKTQPTAKWCSVEVIPKLSDGEVTFYLDSYKDFLPYDLDMVHIPQNRLMRSTFNFAYGKDYLNVTVVVESIETYEYYVLVLNNYSLNRTALMLANDPNIHKTIGVHFNCAGLGLEITHFGLVESDSVATMTF